MIYKQKKNTSSSSWRKYVWSSDDICSSRDGINLHILILYDGEIQCLAATNVN